MKIDARIEHNRVKITLLKNPPFIMIVISKINVKIDIIKFFLVIFVEIRNVNEPNKNCQNLNKGE